MITTTLRDFSTSIHANSEGAPSEVLHRTKVADKTEPQPVTSISHHGIVAALLTLLDVSHRFVEESKVEEHKDEEKRGSDETMR